MATYDTRTARLQHVLSDGETARLVRACANSCERAVVGLLVESGLRPREVCGLRAADVRRDVVRVRGKDGRERIVTLSPQLSDALGSCVCEQGMAATADEPLLLTTRGQPLDVRTIGEMVRGAARRAGLSERLSPHALRATAVRRRWRDVKRRSSGAAATKGED